MTTKNSPECKDSGTDAKAENNDWEATSIKWGHEFVVFTEIEGNEAAGEQVYHDLDAAVFVCLRETDLFAPEPRPDDHGDIARDETKTATFESDLNTVRVTLAGDASIVGEGWEAIETVVAEELSDGFDRVATDGGHQELPAESLGAQTLKPHPHELTQAITGDHVVVFGYNDAGVQFEVSGATDADELEVDWRTIELSADEVRGMLSHGAAYIEQCEDQCGRPYEIEVRAGTRQPKGTPIHTKGGDADE